MAIRRTTDRAGPQGHSVGPLRTRRDGGDLPDKAGNPEPAPELRDTENVPLGQDVFETFEREVLPHVPHAWVNRGVRDKQNRRVGKVGYEINFNRYLYTSPRALAEVEADIRALEGDIIGMLRDLQAGGDMLS